MDPAYGSVELVGTLGGDLSIVNAARTSYDKQSAELSAADRGLIGYLMRNKHGSPFEFVQFHFRVHCPIGVAREWFRHRIGSFNEVSTRYVEMKPDFYQPRPEAMRHQVGKPGHYTFEPLAESLADAARARMRSAYRQAYEAYEILIKVGVARELARNVLPLGLMTTFVWSVNLRSLFNFLSLRTAESALLEIRALADEVERLAEPAAPVAFAAWATNGRIAP